MNFLVIGTDHRFQNRERGLEGILRAFLDQSWIDPLTAIAEEFCAASGGGLRLWLLGGTNTPRSAGEPCKRKFENKDHYSSMLRGVFERSKPLLKPSAVVYVRTDARRFTREATIEALETAFPEKKLRRELYSAPKFTQTTLFHPGAGRGGEIDYVMW